MLAKDYLITKECLARKLISAFILAYVAVTTQWAYADPIDVKINDSLEFTIEIEEGWIARDYSSSYLEMKEASVIFIISEDPIDSSRTFDDNIAIQVFPLNRIITVLDLSGLMLAQAKTEHHNFALQDRVRSLIDSVESEWVLYTAGVDSTDSVRINFLIYYVVKKSHAINFAFAYDSQDKLKYLSFFDRFINSIRWK